MPLLTAFNGGFYQARMPILAADQAVNIYTESRQSSGSSKQKWIYGTPGLDPFLTVTAHGDRGMFSQDGRTWAVVGARLYELNLTAITATDLGQIPDDGFPVSFASNGQGGEQLGIVGGGQFAVLDLLTGALTVTLLPFEHPVMIVFQDGYGLINERDTPRVWFTNLEDFTVIDALDFFARSGTSDNIVGLAVTRDRVWTIGTKTSTQYYDSGDADNPWTPYPGTTIQVDGVTPWCITTYNDVIRWLARSAKGEPRIVQVTADAKVQTLSTPPIVDFLAACSTLDDAEAMVYEQAGHPFFVITCPSSPEDIQTYHFDALENEWGARAAIDASTGQYRRWRARGVTSSDQMILVGDYATGNIYTLDLETYTDNSVTLKRERTFSYFVPAENQWIFPNEAELACQNGVGLVTGADADVNPTVELQISRDGGQTFISAGTAPLGALGNINVRTIWHRLCRMRADRGVLRVTQTAAVKCGWYGLWLNAEAGNGEL